METPKEYYYTYYSYEEWGRGYIGSRKCKCLPVKDINYFGSFTDKTFKPTQKIILKDDYATREEAYADEIILQQYYKVVENPHFANKAYQTSTKFYVSGEQAREYGRKSAIKTKGKKPGMYGKKHTKETKIKMSKVRKGRPGICGFQGRTHTEEARQKMKEKKVVKSFCVISPTGEIICDKNAKQFSKKNNLNSSHFCKVLTGKRKSHKGFRLYRGD